MRNLAIPKLTVILLGLFWLTSASSQQPDYVLSMRVLEGGAEIASPRMMIKKDVIASVGLSADHEVAVGLTVTDHGSRGAHVLAEVETANGTMSPELLVSKGEWAATAVDDLEFQILVEDYSASE